jgi:hypothetical protein
MQFYSLGRYNNSDLNKFLKINNPNSEPAQSLKMKERNSVALTNPKAAIHERFNSKFYLPSKYLNPYGSPHSTFPEKVVTS